MSKKQIIILIIGITLALASWAIYRYVSQKNFERALKGEAWVLEDIEKESKKLVEENPFVGYLPMYGGVFEIHYGFDEDNNIFYEVLLRSSESTSNSEAAEMARIWAGERGFDLDKLNVFWYQE